MFLTYATSWETTCYYNEIEPNKTRCETYCKNISKRLKQQRCIVMSDTPLLLAIHELNKWLDEQKELKSNLGPYDYSDFLDREIAITGNNNMQKVY